MSLKIRWIGQSGYIISDGKTKICIDPYLSDVVNKVAGRQRLVRCPVSPSELCCDAVICSHNHLDHTDTDAISEMNKENKTFFAPSDCEETLKSLGVKKYVPFDIGNSAHVGEFIIEAVFADHTVPAIGVIVKYKDTVLYFTGDTFYNKELEKLKNIDIMFVCINGKLGNMNVDEAVTLTKNINPKVGIPNHYGMFASNTEDPKKYTKQLENGFEMEFNKEYQIDGVRKCLI